MIFFQQADGLWRSDLINPKKFPLKESSGSALVCYALAKGINMGVLTESPFIDAVNLAWQGLETCIINNTYLGYVQSPNFQPGYFNPYNYEDYGAGAFFLAATEVYSLNLKPN